jgi:Transposase
VGVARPTTLDTDLTERIAAVVRAGGTVELAAVATGIGERTVYRWLQRGERTGAANAPYQAFRAAVERARAEAEVILVARMTKAAAAGSWRAAAWLLERQYPERWGPVGERARLRDVEHEHDDDYGGIDALDALDELRLRRRGPAGTKRSS